MSNVIQSDIAYEFDIIWLMKQVEDKDPAVQNVKKFAAPHVSRVNIDIDE